MYCGWKSSESIDEKIKMNVLFISLGDFNSLEERHIYIDLLREFRKHGHMIYVLSPVERRKKEKNRVIREDNCIILKLKIGNIQKTNVIEKGISTIAIAPQLILGIKKYFSDARFDLVLYPTPPITLVSAVEYVKKRDGARTYLLLKDIFPQNAVDIGLMSKTGIKAPLYQYFRNKEKRLFQISDTIGCMSPANVKYVLKHNPEVRKRHKASIKRMRKSIVEVCPNSIEVIDKSVDEEMKKQIRSKYGIPIDKTVFVYGGNLGKPQGIAFLIECLRTCSDIRDVYFLIVGDGTEYSLLESFVETEKPRNVKLMKRLLKEDYDTMVGACDVGMIFLDHSFTIPNFPSRLLSYMQAKIPVLACTDRNTDIGEVITKGGFGWWCESNDVLCFAMIVKGVKLANIKELGDIGFRYLRTNYSVQYSYKIIMSNGDLAYE